MTTKYGNEIVNSFDTYKKISEEYNIDISEVVKIDLNRNGVSLPDNEVREDFRVRFKSSLLNGYNSWYALPVRSRENTPFIAQNGVVYFDDISIGNYDELRLDTCESSYQRGPHLLNLNSRSRSNCGGCKACVHNYNDLYDSTVIKDNVPLRTRQDIESFFDTRDIDVSKLIQIAVVTGLFHGENNVVEHMKLVNDVAKERGFQGELMYFGCEVNSDEALKELASLENFELIYALDNFSNRDKFLAKTKSIITLETAKDTLLRAKDKNIETTISYISGLDSLESMKNGFMMMKDSFTRFPVINIYQIQTMEQAAILNDEAKSLEYYIKSRIELEKLFKDSEYRPRRWENYRPLWYDYYEGEKVKDNAYGQQENIKTKVKNK